MTSEKTAISTPDAPAPAHTFHQGVRKGPFVQVSGQGPVDPATNEYLYPGDVAAQTEQVYRNLARVLEGAGGGLADLVQVTVYLTSRADFDAFNAVRNRVLATQPPPSSTVVVVAGLVVPEHLVEISAVAAVPRSRS